jgi:hypothetical protein
LESVVFNIHDNQYHYRFSARLEAPAEEVRAVVTDIERLPRINDNITLSRVLFYYQDGSYRRQLRMTECVLVFCFNIDFVERVVLQANGDIHTTIIPGAGNFRDGETLWEIEALPDGATRIVMSATQRPDFWIPPVLGPLLLKRAFMSEVTETMTKIEQLAHAASLL